ncbi:hypothetical protein K435DRAFT_963932 [Dendrothele bispora CBS 962.96]|uniref:HMG box domain-containing protein n=1 Tax=Dendrothele bispora (strain CBS 962.96) TaxID=1314807 RepID=A0A4S8MDQ0_DENBC|nr:hypothetical protein K435DRAFT_963932 [Dendrothele bispora CBS 962.96]
MYDTPATRPDQQRIDDQKMSQPVSPLGNPSPDPLDNESSITSRVHDRVMIDFCTNPDNIPTPDLSSLYLTPDSNKKSHTKKRSVGHIPRPRNAFILFRCDLVRQNKIPVEFQADHKNISRMAGMMWKSLSGTRKKPWVELAEMEKRFHAQRYPSYTYHPGRSRNAGSRSKGSCKGRKHSVGDRRKEKNHVEQNEGKALNQESIKGREVKSEEVDPFKSLWRFESEVPETPQDEYNVSEYNVSEPFIKETPCIGHSAHSHPFPVADYRMYRRRSSSCPPPGSHFVSGESVDTSPENGSLFHPNTSGSHSSLVSTSNHNIHITRDDIVQAHWSNRSIHHLSSTRCWGQGDGYSFQPSGLPFPSNPPTPQCSDVVSQVQATNETSGDLYQRGQGRNQYVQPPLPLPPNSLSLDDEQQASRQDEQGQTYVQPPLPLPPNSSSLDDEQQVSHQDKIDWTFAWAPSSKPENAPPLVSGPYRQARPRDAPSWVAAQWELEGIDRTKSAERERLIQNYECPPSPRTIQDPDGSLLHEFESIDWVNHIMDYEDSGSDRIFGVTKNLSNEYHQNDSEVGLRSAPRYPPSSFTLEPTMRPSRSSISFEQMRFNFPLQSYQEYNSFSAPNDSDISNANVNGGSDMVNDLGLLFPRLSLDENAAGPSSALLLPPPSPRRAMADVD